MAGLGRKVFNAGEVLSAANVQGYLQDQVVQVYSGTAARSSALGTAVSEGMMSYLTDANELSVYTSNGTAAWSPVNLEQSPNVIINGAFDINQRNFTSVTTSSYFHFDRWKYFGLGSGVTTITPQTIAPGTISGISGPEIGNCVQFATSSQSLAGDASVLPQYIEDVRTLSGKTVTVSFYAKANSGTPKIGIDLTQNFGSGGSPSSEVSTAAGAVTLSTSWARYSVTVALPSISGKTIGSNNNSALILLLWVSAGSDWNSRASSIGLQNNTFQITGVQLEAGSVATPFRRSSPTLQGELAACQRYAYAINGSEGNSGLSVPFAQGHYISSSTFRATAFFPVKMRGVPSLTSTNATGHFQIQDTSGISYSTVGMDFAGPNAAILQVSVSGRTAGQGGYLKTDNASAQLLFSAEL